VNDLPDSFELQEMVRDTSQRHGLSQELLNAVMQVESGGDPQAVSRSGARGLMQLMPQTATMLGVSDSFNPSMNLDGGARYLRSLLDRYDGDLDRALGAYNAGPGAVDRYDGVPPYPETQRYVDKVRQLISTSEEQ
jgi:soluble lytic murein transglycosylase-like protein